MRVGLIHPLLTFSHASHPTTSGMHPPDTVGRDLLVDDDANRRDDARARARWRPRARARDDDDDDDDDGDDDGTRVRQRAARRRVRQSAARATDRSIPSMTASTSMVVVRTTAVTATTRAASRSRRRRRRRAFARGSATRTRARIDDDDGDDDAVGDDDGASRNPMRALGLDDVDVDALTMADVRAAYRATMKRTHPDAPGGSDAAAIFARAAYETLARAVASNDVDALRRLSATMENGDGDPFSPSTIRATFDGARSVFVDETRCAGEDACSRSCARRAPESFARASDTGAARATTRAGTFDETSPEAYAEWMAAAQCPNACVWFVTEAQREALDDALRVARDGDARVEDVGARIAAMIARAEYNNGREAGRRAAERGM